MFDPPEAVDIAHESSATAGFGGGQRYSADETLRRVHEAQPDLPRPRTFVSLPFRPVAVVADIGALDGVPISATPKPLLDSIPTRLREAARDAAAAQALVYGLLLERRQIRARPAAGPGRATCRRGRRRGGGGFAPGA